MANSKINKLLFDVFLPQEDPLTALQKAKDLLHNRIIDILNETFDQVPDDIYIDSLVIDLGAIDMQVLKQNLKEHLQKHLKKKGDFPAKEKLDLPTLAENNRAHSPQNEWSATDRLLFYLQHGYWFWNVQSEDENKIDQFLDKYFSDEHQVQVLITNLRQQPENVIDRFLITAFSEPFIRNAVIQSLQGIHPMFNEFVSLLSKDYAKYILIQEHLDYHLFYQLISSGKLNDLSDLKAIVIKAIHENAIDEALNETAIILWEQAIQQSESVEAVKDVLSEVQTKKKKKELLKDRELDKKSDLLTGNKRKNMTKIATDKAFDGKEIKENEKISIDNAGLVLFHVYLPFMFKELEWIDESNKFINAQKQAKAVHLLQYIITGKSRNKEHLMVLNKILCGWPIHLPITQQCNFTKTEKEVVTHLIESMKEHWPVIKNTSDAGLIESFIKRNGIIKSSESDFLLQVESKTIDVLLDSLPFGFKTIKLPWNDYTIHTEWR